MTEIKTGLASFDRIYKILSENNWNRTITARTLGMCQPSVNRIVREARNRGIELAITLPMNPRVLPIPESIIQHALAECLGNKDRAATYLGVAKSTFRKHCKRYGIPSSRWKKP
jgi:DNA-binding NtrC family response regulator